MAKGKRLKPTVREPAGPDCCDRCVYALIGGQWVLYLMHRLCPCHGDGRKWMPA